MSPFAPIGSKARYQIQKRHPKLTFIRDAS